jgi:hypothetical protein
MNPLRARVVEVAAAELGPQNPDKYWREVQPAFVGKPHSVAWCGGFSLWCLRQALPACADWTWKPAVGFVYRYKLPTVRPPEPGDVAYFEYVGGSKLDHYAIVDRVEGQLLHTIDGNQGTAPTELVARRVRPLLQATLLFSIRELVRPTERAPAPESIAPPVDPSRLPTLSAGPRDPETATYVELLQQRLNATGTVPPLLVDGHFGPKTDEAVRMFQRQHVLTPDRIVGPRTWRELLREVVAF